MAVDLGQLARLDPRQLWQREAFDFTPWLAGNLGLLGQALGMDLELVGRESAVGTFSADIVARDLNRDRVVLIENQLKGTDHGHLGQLITYAAGLDATTIVWISPEMREEHRQALDWLNRRTDSETEFFGVVLELLQIDRSRPAVNFRLVAFPNTWGRRGPPPTDRQKAYQQFFQRLIDELRDKHRFTNARAAQPANWYSFAAGLSGIFYGARFGHGNRLSAGIYIDRGNDELNRAILDQLRQMIGTSELMPAEPLEWKPLEGTRVCRVEVSRPGSSSIPASEVEQEVMLRWTIERLLKLKEVVGPKLQSAVSTAEEHLAVAVSEEDMEADDFPDPPSD